MVNHEHIPVTQMRGSTRLGDGGPDDTYEEYTICSICGMQLPDPPAAMSKDLPEELQLPC